MYIPATVSSFLCYGLALAQAFVAPGGLAPADSQAIESIYAQHKVAQTDVAERLGADPDVRKLVCASTSLAGFVSKNSSIHLTPTLKTPEALKGFKDVGLPMYDTCQVRTCHPLLFPLLCGIAKLWNLAIPVVAKRKNTVKKRQADLSLVARASDLKKERSQ